MKTAKILTPIIMLVLVFSMLALTFAWFSANQQAETTSVLTVGSYIKVEFDGDGALGNEKYNGQKGYDENGVAYTDDDKAYEAYYHTYIKLQGDGDLSLKFKFSDLVIEVSETFYMLSAKRTVDEIISKFDGYDPDKSHIGKAEKVVGENGADVVFTEPQDGSVGFVYTTDGTVNGDVLYIKLDKANTDKFFAMEYAKITSDDPPYEYGTFAKEGERLPFTYGANLPAYSSEVVSDSSFGKSNPVCVKIIYSDAGYARTFPFSGESFKGSLFGFGVIASAEYR